MIDIHSHILPGLDDGAPNMDVSVGMARLAVASGIRQMVATPHVKTRHYPSKELILEAVSKLQDELHNKGVRLPILPGAEYRINPELPKRYSKGEILTINNKGLYLLIEFSDASVPDYTVNVFDELLLQGAIPVIAHPERNNVFIKDHSRLYDLIARGSLAQLTAGSLTGYYCPVVTDAARAFLEQGLVHFIGSDAHSVSGQLPHFAPAAREILNLVGEEQGRRLLKLNSQKAIRGELIEIGDLKKKAI